MMRQQALQAEMQNSVAAIQNTLKVNRYPRAFMNFLPQVSQIQDEWLQYLKCL